MASNDRLSGVGGGDNPTLSDLLLPSVRLGAGVEGAYYLLVYLVSIMLLLSSHHALTQSGVCC